MSRIDEKGRELFDFVCTSIELVKEVKKYFNWYSGVPDSVFKSVIPKLEPYYFSSRENHCIGMAFGAKVGGKMPCIFMQNSGLGLALDAILGLFKLYNLGLVVFLSNRGELKWEEVQHREWGKITMPLLKLIGAEVIDFEMYGLNSVRTAYEISTRKNEVVFILVHRGNIDEEN